ncbi:hypothetical protein NC653_010217 [Populus alba x Populus x berolinensis]|uniref:Malic enzyme N-terminal domain-containing protein n=1 Tax=Populus alba x Populus x berolinensis TaxID=444605 RepID=A0AAD6QZ99_9ROSI|nr:hypothetical protein NC653_010217 [Populus alba x Populus x berolinensis]
MHHQTHCLSVLEKGWGFRLSAKEERGKILKASKDWAERNIQVIVVTDGECIFGLGGLGCQLLKPSNCIRYTQGTNNEKLLNDEFYIGFGQRRVTRQVE